MQMNLRQGASEQNAGFWYPASEYIQKNQAGKLKRHI